MVEISNQLIRDRTAAMRQLSDDDRSAAIDASPNVIGFARFASIANQRHLAEGYRSPRVDR